MDYFPGFPNPRSNHLHGKLIGSPAQSGIATMCMALAMIGAAKPAAYDKTSRYDNRALPHFQQRRRAAKKHRGRG